ncbi:hypothetical protein [Bradyrhizobium ivorense]|uniref:hypothetical protein n=1 Tax=Bradyrhizobium ivorense TaxID=2511166 RepID=UPI0011167EB0|nr:hypothetical protein [Bradyrhizobium ivorense]
MRDAVEPAQHAASLASFHRTRRLRGASRNAFGRYLDGRDCVRHHGGTSRRNSKIGDAVATCRSRVVTRRNARKIIEVCVVEQRISEGIASSDRRSPSL